MENNNITIPIKELERRFKSIFVRLPIIVGNEVVNFALDNFKSQSFAGYTMQPWRRRKSTKNIGRAILIKSGRLRRSIRVINATTDTVTVGTDVPYAKAHNEGVNSSVTVKAFARKKGGKTSIVRSHIRKMNLPKRQFLGESPYLTQRIKRQVNAQILKSLK